MKKLMTVRIILFICAFLFSGLLHAQQVTVTGTITDAEDGLPLPGVSILEKGTTNGTITNFDGNFTLSVRGSGTLVVSFVGYISQEIPVNNQTTLNLTMQFDVFALEEVVAIGYGTTRKEDATGSVAAVSADDFNRGAITSPQELISGKIAGVQITNSGGAPGEGATIRIRGGSSLSASNDPLIVIDGVPIDNDGISGMRNPLNTIHPNDIETFTVLKDASATAIYGSRASNGVIIITTKKGKANRPFRVKYYGNVSVGTRSGEIDVLSGGEYRDLINDRFTTGHPALDILGTENTDWQSEIYQTSISHDHNLSFSGSVSMLPYRVSLGYSDQQGILKTDGLDRFTGSINLNPALLDGSLTLDLNVKGMYIKNNFANRGAIGSAVAFDPTQPIKDVGNGYDDWFTWTQPSGDPNLLAPSNPLAQLNMRDDQSTVYRSLGNIQADYKMPFLPDLTAKLNLGYDISNSEGTIMVPENAPWAFDAVNGGGEDTKYTQDKKNSLLDFYFNYKKEIGSIDSRINATAGYSWQHFWRAGTSFRTNVAGNDTVADTDYETESYIVSFFGRLNYVFKDRYLLTFTLRQDGSSRFSPDTRWGLFPSIAFAWDIADEPFVNPDLFSTLKLRLGYGITGQQNIGNDYPYLGAYTASEPTARYLFGNNFITTLRPEGYDANIKWEETTTYNIGFDFGILNNRIAGSIDAYHRETRDLLNFIPVPAGTNLTNQILTNVGDLTNTGVEFNITARAISTVDMVWELGYNITYNVNEITKLTATDDENYEGVRVGGISGAVGNTIAIHSVGYPARSFYVWEQVYDDEGFPVEGLYVDRDGDGLITDEDRYRLHKAAPDVLMGFSSLFQYKNFDFSFSGRVNLGNFIYNNVYSNNSSYNNLYWATGYMNNTQPTLFETKFENPQYFSDHYIENASFFRMDNISLGYNLEGVIPAIQNIRLSATVQNAFVITKYTGLDPEVFNGVDSNIYPRPRTFVFGVSVEF